MKTVEEVTACVVDYGTFVWVAETLAETMERVYYYSPCEDEYKDVRNCVKGDGLDRVSRLDDFLDPDVLETIDLFVFPDIGFGGIQRHLAEIGKAVWGHMGADQLELYRDHFLHVLKEAGLPTIHSERIEGLTALSQYLKTVKNKWIKVNRFRGNMETWHHLDYRHSLLMLNRLAVVFGSMKEQIVFIVQDDIASDLEVGYDGWCIDGEFPSISFQGYEGKNELYLGSALAEADLPEEIRFVNERMASVLADYGYRCWWETEIRIVDGTPYFIDATTRLAGQTTEHQAETIANFADVVWQGANGIVIEPEISWDFAAEACLHYTLTSVDASVDDSWKSLEIPANVLPWIKMMDYFKLDGIYHFVEQADDEIGVVLGVGDSLEEAIRHLQDNLDDLSDLPVRANIGGFATLLDAIKQAESQGIAFGGRVPPAALVFKDARNL